MTEAIDLAVIGAGPAGMSAAIAASTAGVRTIVIDEAPLPGGQVYRPLPAGFRVRDAAALGPDHAVGDGLRRELDESPAEKALAHRAWSVGDGFRIDALGPDGPRVWQARAIIVATGTTERIVPFPGWTTPGVIGLAAATIMLKSQQLLPGGRTVVAGCGPLLAAVAIGIIEGGGAVAAVVDLAGPGDWIASLPALASRPDLLARGARWIARLRARGIPIHARSAVVAAEGATRVEAVTLRAVDRDGRARTDGPERRISCDSVAIGHGLVPNCDIARLLGAAHRFEAARGGWIASRDGDMRTSVPGVYVAGDGGGIAGAAAAALQGRIAGLAAACDLGAIGAGRLRSETASLRAALARAERFGAAMSRVMQARPALVDGIPADCPVCRCEDVTRAEIEQAMADGASDVNQVKAWTRAGMGPCQGRICGDTVAALVAARVGSRERAGAFTVRVPLRPLPTDALIGSFDYADIPIPKPAPL